MGYVRTYITYVAYVHTIAYSDTMSTVSLAAGITVFHMVNKESQETFEIIKAENCPKELKKRLKKMAVEKEVDLQDLLVRYCREGVERDESKLKPS